MNTSSKVGLWFLRKALYVAVGSAVAGVAGALAPHGSDYSLSTLTLHSVLAGAGSAVFGDIRRALFPDLLQVVAGEDPRKDG